MKKIIILFLLMLSSSMSYGEEKRSAFGIGAGSHYNGLGVNFGTYYPGYYQYYSLGCYAIGYGGGNGFIYDCGVGFGFLTTSIFKNNKHGIGGSVGLSHVGGRLYSSSISDAGPFNTQERSGPAYQISTNYAYFFEGLGEKGWNIGAAVILESFKGDIKYGFTPSVGFQY